MGQDLLIACIGCYISNSTILTKAMVAIIAIAMVVASHTILSHFADFALVHLNSIIEPPTKIAFLGVEHRIAVSLAEHIEVLMSCVVLTAWQ